ncbi:MAG: fumarylacetoacetate hydrolase family protein [Deinococcales bacterium]
MSSTPQDPRIVAGMTRQLEVRRQRLATGEASLGWKLGFGTPAAMERLGIEAPLVGFLVDGATVEPGSTVSVAGWTNPVVEPEIAVIMGRDLPHAAHRDAVREAIAAVAPAIELADLSFPPEDVEAILASDVYQRHVVLGRPDETRGGGRLDGLVATVDRDGARIATTDDPLAATGDLIDNVMHVANLLASLGEVLRAGEIILTGSIIPPIRADRSTEVRYVLDPIDTISVRLAQ